MWDFYQRRKLFIFGRKEVVIGKETPCQNLSLKKLKVRVSNDESLNVKQLF